jgi:hypothetical protein
MFARAAFQDVLVQMTHAGMHHGDLCRSHCSPALPACCMCAPPDTHDSGACCRSPVTQTQLFGYSLAFLGVCLYNYRKVQSMKQAAVGASKAPDKPGAQQDMQEPLLTERRSGGSA